MQMGGGMSVSRDIHLYELQNLSNSPYASSRNVVSLEFSIHSLRLYTPEPMRLIRALIAQ